MNISHDEYPKQGSMAGQVMLITFNYDTSRHVRGLCVRDDREEPFQTIFKLEDGRYVLATECQYREPFAGEA